ncbi:MAG: hypothetical protein COS25_01695 [Candidatus Nealsonbacteria bacterium CG02_land_8_20_14_3_00_37_10]|uniref:Uncharacterized protein n=1 Tax=Candidatus Nealsonbacteria bacterium CG02_land_8_20_14_3_00_37_10 TaxID=1974699 RepID=A0A2M7D9I2_9BACT|nr:MAG: hypothetical protein COS25_01695 [Candidatus Nealsonbacteria bacterium CG02_land_8_20_14_3_00_37_10]
MKFIIKEPLKDNIYNLARKIGYHFQGKEKEQEELSFVRPPRGYPRFHIYLKVENDNLIFNLHLDQKRPIYKGTTAHSGEYEGEIVEKEAKRIKQILQ